VPSERTGWVPGEWVDEFLLAGNDYQLCLFMGKPVHRRELRQLVDQQQREMAAAGLAEGGTVSLRLPPSLAFVASLLAAWRLGAQASLLDHRLAPGEVERALGSLAPQVVVTGEKASGPALAGYAQVETVTRARPGGRPATTEHCLIQLSSGSTGPSKVIGRTAAELIAELDRYSRLAEYPKPGERIVLLASIVHVLGLVGGLLHSLHAGLPLAYPDRITADGIADAVAAGPEPTMLLGVPFHAELLCAVAAPRPLPQFTRMVVAGELTRPGVAERFTGLYRVPLGSMYGMTELGVIATDLTGSLRPSVDPAPGMHVALDQGELLVKMAASPYVGLSDPTRWADGWLHTRDAARIDPGTGLVTILGRLDSQVSVGGLKVDLTEVEQTLCALPQVTTAVVIYDAEITAFLVLTDGASLADAQAALATELAAYKQPRRLHVVAELPRTATGKIVRDHAALRAAASLNELSPSRRHTAPARTQT
jgi:3-hydroxy-4-methylanthranilate adenylyltransferase